MNIPSKYVDLQSKIMVLVDNKPGTWNYSACGVTRSELPIPAIVHQNAYKGTSDQIRILLIGGLSGFARDVEIAIKSIEMFSKNNENLSEKIALSAIPCANPAGLIIDSGPSNGAGGTVIKGYPPVDGFFFDRENPEIRYIWRWICYQAPDLVIEIQDATVDSDGNLQPPRPVEGASMNFQELRPAFEKCRESLDGMTFGRERVDVNEQIDDLLEVTECLRDAGFDLDDPNQENLREWRGQFDFEDPALQKAFEDCGRLGRGQSGGGPGSGPPNGRNSGPARGNGR